MLRRYFWPVLVFLSVGLLTWCPYVLLNIINHVPWSVWRFPVIPQAIYDADAYFQWISASLSGVHYGIHLRSFDSVIKFLNVLIEGRWYAMEVWLFTLWICVSLGVIFFARAVELWSGVSKGLSRWFSILCFLTLIWPYMPRPAVFTWHVPFYALGLICVWFVMRALEMKRYVKSGIWTALAIFSTWVYPYYLMHVGLWIGILWLMHLYGRFPRFIRGLFVSSVIAVVPVCIVCTSLLFRPNLMLAFELQERLGLAFSRLPVLSNSLIALIVGCVFLIACMQAFKKRISVVGLYEIAIGWFALLLCWFSSVFTKVYIHNDHFRAPVVFLSWLGLAVVWHAIRTAENRSVEEKAKDVDVSKGLVIVHVVLFLISLIMLSRYAIQKAYVFHDDLLNIVHVSHWFALTISSWLVVRHLTRHEMRISRMIAIYTAIAIAIGLAGRGYVFAIEAKTFKSYISFVPIIDWLREHTKGSDGICTDPKDANMIGAYSSRIAYPTYASVFLPLPDRHILNDLRIELGYYDAAGAKQEFVYINTLDSMRGTTCDQFNVWSRVFRSFGMSAEDFDKLSDCQRENILSTRKEIASYLNVRFRDDEAFKKLCLVVVVSSDQEPYWSIPPGYQKTRIDPLFSVWVAQ